MRAFVSVLRIVFFAIWSVFCILFASLCCLLIWSKKPTLYFAKHLWSPIAIWIMGGKLIIQNVEKLDPNLPYVVMANHCSYLDIPALFLSFPTGLHFVAKKELRRMPFLGWFMILSDMIFIDRKNTVAAKESLAEAAQLINQGKNVVVFPEGTASKNGQVAPFKKGGFHLANDAKAFIVPVKIEGTYRVWPSASKLKIQRGVITVKYSDPVSPEEYRKLELDQRIDFIKEKIERL